MSVQELAKKREKSSLIFVVSMCVLPFFPRADPANTQPFSVSAQTLKYKLMSQLFINKELILWTGMCRLFCTATYDIFS